MKRTITILTIALLVAAGCSTNKEKGVQGPADNSDLKTIHMKIDMKMNGTRADEASASGTSAPLYSAIIYFLDGSPDPVIFDVKTVGINGADVTIADIEAGYRFEGIPSSVTQVYVVGNYNVVDTDGNTPSYPTQDGETLSSIQSTVLNIEQVSHGALTDGRTFGELITVMDGEQAILTYSATSTWTGTTTLTDGDLFAEVTISPIVSRIEIEELTYTGTLRNLTVEGIYINYYYPNVPLSLDYTGLTYVDNGSDVENYDISDPAFQYEDYMTLFDIINEELEPGANGGTDNLLPVNGAWAYQVFGDSAPVPHIIIKFTGIYNASGQFINTPRYLTVSGYTGTGGVLASFERNHIYKIQNLEFNDDDLEIFPETESKAVYVHVVVAPWITDIVTPII